MNDVINVLYVDDDKDLLEIVPLGLSREGFLVFAARNAAEAIEILTRKKINIIVTDMNMPGQSGVELLNFIRKEISNDIPVVLVSSYSGNKKYLSCGFNDFISKPFNSSYLAHKIREILIINPLS